MNLLNYTKKLYEKIKFYDKITRKSPDKYLSNPFARPVNLTVIWVENRENQN